MHKPTLNAAKLFYSEDVQIDFHSSNAVNREKNAVNKTLPLESSRHSPRVLKACQASSTRRISSGSKISGRHVTASYKKRMMAFVSTKINASILKVETPHDTKMIIDGLYLSGKNISVKMRLGPLRRFLGS